MLWLIFWVAVAAAALFAARQVEAHERAAKDAPFAPPPQPPQPPKPPAPDPGATPAP